MGSVGTFRIPSFAQGSAHRQTDSLYTYTECRQRLVNICLNSVALHCLCMPQMRRTRGQRSPLGQYEKFIVNSTEALVRCPAEKNP